MFLCFSMNQIYKRTEITTEHMEYNEENHKRLRGKIRNKRNTVTCELK